MIAKQRVCYIKEGTQGLYFSLLALISLSHKLLQNNIESAPPPLSGAAVPIGLEHEKCVQVFLATSGL